MAGRPISWRGYVWAFLLGFLVASLMPPLRFPYQVLVFLALVLAAEVTRFTMERKLEPWTAAKEDPAARG